MIITKTKIGIGFAFAMFLAASATGNAEAAATGTLSGLAQSGAIKQAEENVKDRVSALATAKDDKEDNLALRIEAFKKVVDLSITEAEDLKVNLVLKDADKIWRDSVLERADRVIGYLKKQKALDFEKIEDIETIKDQALDFRKWREDNFLPLISEVGDFLAIQKSEKAIVVAKERVVRVKSDLATLKESGIDNPKYVKLSGMFVRASSSIEAGAKASGEARDAFFARYVKPLALSPTISSTSSSSSASSPQTQTQTLEPVSPSSSASSSPAPAVLSAQSTVAPAVPPLIFSSSSSAASSTLNVAQEPAAPVVLSIKDMVRDSFAEVKGAYQIFIEMSGLVRKLLS